MNVIPGRRIVSRPGTATRVQGRCEGCASATPSQLLPSAGAVGDRCPSYARTPSGASAPMGRLNIPISKEPRRRLPIPKFHPARKFFSHCAVAVRLKGDNKSRSMKVHSYPAYGERYAAVGDLDRSFQTNDSVGAILVRICTGVTLYSRTSPARASVVSHVGARANCASRSCFVILSPDRATDSR